MIIREWSGDEVGGLDSTFQTLSPNTPYHSSRRLSCQGTGTRLLAYSPLGSLASSAGRVYVEFTGWPTSSNPIIAPLTSGGASAWRVRLSSTGTLIVDNPSNTAVGTSAAMSLNTVYRLEWVVTATTFELRIYVGDTMTQLGATVSATNTFGALDNFRMGQVSSTPNIPPYFIDRLAISDTAALIGPTVKGAAVTDPVVAIIGDSLTNMAPNASTILGEGQTLVGAALEARGWELQNVYFWGVGGKRISVADLTGRTSASNVADAVALLGPLDHVIIALGTNDRPQTDATVNAAIDTLFAAIGSGPQIVVIGLTSAGSSSADDVRVTNLWAAKCASRGNAVVADWESRARSLDGGGTGTPYWQVDGVHMTPAGYAERAAFYAEQLPNLAEVDPAEGAASGAWTVVAAGGGERASAGAATGGASIVGSAAGASARRGTALSAWLADGDASGVRASRGAAIGSTSSVGAAAGARRPQGAVAGGWSVLGVASASTVPGGVAAGSWAASGSASAARAARGGVAASWTLAGAADGRVLRGGAAVSGWAYAGASVGRSGTEVLWPAVRTLTGVDVHRSLAGVSSSRSLVGVMPAATLEGGDR